MEIGETLLEVARRHVRGGEDIILRQRGLVQHLEATQSPLAEEARALLSEFQSTQDDHVRHLAQIEAEMQTGLRDAEGNLRPLKP